MWYPEILWMSPTIAPDYWERSFAHHLYSRLLGFKTLEEAHGYIRQTNAYLLSTVDVPVFRVRFVHSDGRPPRITSKTYNIPLTAEGEEPL